MKRLTLFTVALGFAVANANADPVEFRGGLCLSSVNAACTADGWGVGDCLLLRYSPPNLGTNGVTTELSLLGQTYADNYSLASGTLVGTTYKTVAALHVGRIGYSFSSTARITAQTPVSATSKSVSLSGNVTDFSSTVGCTVGFQAAAARRP